MNMIYCAECGAQNEEGAKYCEVCGAPMEENTETAESSEAVSAERDVAPAAESNGYDTPAQGYAASGRQQYRPAGSLPPKYGGRNGGGQTGLAIASLICGIVSVLCCCFTCCLNWIPAAAAVVCGIITLVQHRDGKGMAITGLVLGVAGLLLGVVWALIMGPALSEWLQDGLRYGIW